MVPDSLPEQLSFIADLFSNTRLRRDFVTSIVDKLHEWTGCDCVGIRIVNPDDSMPYEAYVGFSQAFWDEENWLSLRTHQCGCIRVVNNKLRPVDQPVLTASGSILSNDLQAFGRSLSPAEACLYRGKCIESGFGSLALVPIRNQNEVIGLIHLADTRTNMLAPTMIQTLETVTGPITEVIDRFSAEDRLTHKKAEIEQFIRSVSHDLKSPLITIRTFLEMLRQDLPGSDQQQINEDINYIDKAADKMHQMLEALLRYSRIGRKESLAQSISVHQPVEESLTALAGILQTCQVHVATSELSHQLHGDPLHFGQIWQNLIENAVKYMGDQQHPQIEIGATQQGSDVVFYVGDNGMGIAAEHSKRIFNLFSQLSATSEGSGLGLAMVKKIVESYQGKIWVESVGWRRGSCFKFTLPVALKTDTAI